MELDDLDRQIVGALQVDGRASWRRIADVLEMPFSTVTRRGRALLESGAVVVRALRRGESTALFEIETVPQRVDAVAREIAARPESNFVYALSAPTRILVEEFLDPESLARSVLDELPAFDGVTGVTATPVLDYYRTLTEWMPGLISPEQAAALSPSFGVVRHGGEPVRDEALYSLLARDGRMPLGELADALGQSEGAVRRRLNALLENSVEVRAVVAPGLVGLPVSAFVWARVEPSAVERVAAELLASPHVRYAAMTMGDRQLLVDVAFEGLGSLREFLVDPSWADGVESTSASIVLRAYKRGGLVVG